MIKYQKAINIINKVSLNLSDEKISTLDSLNRVCAKNILSPTKNPLSNILLLMVLRFWQKKQEDCLKKKIKNLKF